MLVTYSWRPSLLWGIINEAVAATFQQYYKMPVALVAKLRRNLSDAQVAGVSLATMAAATDLYSPTGHDLPVPWTKDGMSAGHGKAIIIFGGSSSVGQYANQLAKISGFEGIVTNN
ncbi:hypothetical protein BP6252_10810 [Coleophoma cylindrospora]|uniref:Uncharacterized protein n=1 Tax=Coleophoma cylindrospora TaxID=1849047 RepID=A0A3D8QN92_9HELO|nr:hypothetical protein BP6252_10810 [Coleophoma cylindrospora]